MTSGKKVVWGVIGVVAVFCLVGVVVAVKLKGFIYQGIPAPVKSPDGREVVVLSVTDKMEDKDAHMRVVVEIQDAGTGKVEFRKQTAASALREYGVAWEGGDKVVLTSTEVGKVSFVREKGEWKEGEVKAEGVVPVRKD